MTSVKSPGKVLVTGANGFIATWIVQVLISRGYSVVGTVRSVPKGTFLKQLFGDKFEFAVVGDLAEMDAFDEVVKSVSPDAIIHTASPASFDPSIDPETTIRQAVQGTLGVLQSAQQFGSKVKRVVITSSVVSLLGPNPSYTYTEKDWNTQSEEIIEREGKNTPVGHRYQASKKRAEQAAWKFINENKDLQFDITTILPSLVWGPILHNVEDISSLNVTIEMFRQGIINQVVPKPFPNNFLDVRDVALAHVLALETPEASGERIIVSNDGSFFWHQITDVLIQAGHPVTPHQLGDTSIPPAISFENSKSKKMLGLNYRPHQETAVDTYAELKKRFPESFP